MKKKKKKPALEKIMSASIRVEGMTEAEVTDLQKFMRKEMKKHNIPAHDVQMTVRRKCDGCNKPIEDGAEYIHYASGLDFHNKKCEKLLIDVEDKRKGPKRTMKGVKKDIVNGIKKKHDLKGKVKVIWSKQALRGLKEAMKKGADAK